MHLGKTIAAIVALVWLLNVSIALAFGGPQERVIIIVADKKEESRNLQLDKALNAQLSDLGATTIVELFEDLMPPPQEEQIALWKERFQGKLLALIYFSLDTGFLHIVVFDKTAKTEFTKPLPQHRENWSQACDAISSMIRSALMPWLGEGSGDSSIDSVKSKRERTPKEKKEELHLPLSAGAAYNLTSLNFDGAFAHGPLLSLAIAPIRYLELGLSISFFVKTKIVAPDSQTLFFSKLPLTFFAAGIVPIRSLDLGIKLACVVDFTDVEGIHSSLDPDNARLVRPGFSSTIFARYNFSKRFRVYVDFGTQVFKEPYRYYWSNNLIFVHEVLLLRTLIGFELVFDLR